MSGSAPPSDWASDFAPFARKLRERGAPASVQRAFRRAFDQLARGERGLIFEAELEPPGALPTSDDIDEATARAGRALLPHAVLLKLNGGHGATMGLEGPKSLLEVKAGQSFLDLIAHQLGRLRARHNAPVPLVLMNSAPGRSPTLAALARHGALSGALDADFLQHQTPRIRAADLTPVTCPENPEREWCSPGHGDFYFALRDEGMLEQMRRAGLRYAFVSNADNLGAVLDPALLGWFAASGAPFAMEVKRRRPSDRKGGHLARSRDGDKWLLREIAQCPFAERAAFQDIERWRFFNTNNVWLDLEALASALADANNPFELPMICNQRPLDPLTPDSEAVLQLETALGAAISRFEGACAIVVPARRFVPVKSTADLLALRSDAFSLNADFEPVPTPGGQGAALQIELDAGFERLSAFEARLPHGPPSLLDCTRLRLRGDVRFGRGVRITGDVRIEAPPGETLEIPDGAELSG